MKVENKKEGKQSRFVNETVKLNDEKSLDGKNLLGEEMDSIEVGKEDMLIQIGNLRNDRKRFHNPQDGRVYSAKGCCTTLTLAMPPKFLIEDDGEYKVRELSGYEGLLLMGVSRDDADRIREVVPSNAQMMKLAGNSIIVDVMSSFYKELVKC